MLHVTEGVSNTARLAEGCKDWLSTWQKEQQQQIVLSSGED